MSTPPDPFEFVKQLWGQMAVPGFGLNAGAGMGGMGAPGAAQMPSFDPKELETRLAQLKQVRQWLEMNMNVMNLQINTIEMQLAAMSGFKDASEKMFGGSKAATDHWTQAVAGSKTVGGSASAGNAAGGAAPAAPWMDPQAWMTFMQSQAAATQQAAQKAMHDGAAAMQSAARDMAQPAAKQAAKQAAKRAAKKSARTTASASSATSARPRKKT